MLKAMPIICHAYSPNCFLKAMPLRNELFAASILANGYFFTLHHMLTTVTFVSFDRNKGRAFASMGLLPRQIRNAAGLRFFKLMGSGRGRAFSIMPDFSRYCLLAAWDSEAHARQFFSTHPQWLAYRGLAAGILQFTLEPLSVKGSWNGQQPFEHPNQKPPEGTPIAIITRASLHWHRLPSFWKHARTSTADLPEADGLHYSVGIGEVPYVEQATFSVWQDAAKMMAFVTAPAHLQAIRLRHQEGWYKEEMFARFTVSQIQCDRPELFAGIKELQAMMRA